ncbi:hypothetical protein NQZ79_g8632 [Umbelopsis isabellina]|nr:hypothetical protein NQZ79_g8632 [Umbelopsis isabellina]
MADRKVQTCMQSSMKGRAQLFFLSEKGSEAPSQICGHFFDETNTRNFGLAGRLLDNEPFRNHENCCLEPTAKYKFTLQDYATKDYYDVPLVKRAIDNDAGNLETDCAVADDSGTTETTMSFETDRFIVDNVAWEQCGKYLGKLYNELVSRIGDVDKENVNTALTEEFDLVVCYGQMYISLGKAR